MVADRYQDRHPNGWLSHGPPRWPTGEPVRIAGLMPPREPVDLPLAPVDGIELVRDPRGIRERVEQLAGSARHSICALQQRTGGGYPAEPVERGRLRAIPTRVVVESGSAGEYGSVLVRRSANPLPYRMVIIDETVAVAARQGGPGRGVAMVVAEPVLVQGLQCLFEVTWAGCARAGSDNPTLAERGLLEQMAAGSTDQAIARLLGVSDRQVRRRTAHLLQRLGVSSRFAAGAEAVRRGWL